MYTENQSRLVLCLLLAACQFDPASVAGGSGGRDGASLGDDTSDPPDGQAPTVDGAPRPDALPGFGQPVMIVDTGFSDDDPSLTGDGLELFFGSDAGPGTDEDIWSAERARADLAFETPALVPNLATDLEDTTMKVSADGLSLVFTRVVASDPELFIATRTSRSAEWSSGTAIAELNTTSSEWSPFLLADGLTLLFCSNRTGDEEIYAATRPSPSAAFGQPVRLTTLGTTDHECDPMMPSPDVIFFVRQYVANLGDSDIFMARRQGGAGSWDFGEITRLDELKTASQDRDPWVSADLSTIYFSSDRGGGYDVFMATR